MLNLTCWTGFILTLLYATWTIFSILVLKVPSSGAVFFLTGLPILFLFRFLTSPPEKPTKELQLAAALFIYCFASLIVQNIAQDDQIDYFGKSAQAYTAAMLVIGAFWFMSGSLLADLKIKTSNAAALAIILLTGLAVLPNAQETKIISYATLAEAGVEGVSHLLITDMLLLVGYICYALSSGISRKIIFLFAAAIVFAGGGRSAFYLGIGSILIHEIIFGSRANKLFFLSTIALLFGYLMIDAGNQTDDVLQRMIFSEGFKNDGSFVERNEIFQIGLPMLQEQILFGNPSLIVEAYGVTGGYIHNILSAWQFYGFIPFAILITILFRITTQSYRAIASSRQPIDVIGSLALIYTLLGISSSKHVGFIFLWFTLGYWIFRLKVFRPAAPRLNSI